MNRIEFIRRHGIVLNAARNSDRSSNRSPQRGGGGNSNEINQIHEPQNQAQNTPVPSHPFTSPPQATSTPTRDVIDANVEPQHQNVAPLPTIDEDPVLNQLSNVQTDQAVNDATNQPNP